MECRVAEYHRLLVPRDVATRSLAEYCEYLKELLKDRFTVVSGSFREIGGRKVRVRKAHLRKRKR